MSAIVIPGEASETDEEDEDDADCRQPKPTIIADVPAMVPVSTTGTSSSGGGGSIDDEALRETMSRLDCDARALATRHCLALGKQLQHVAVDVCKTQRVMQESCHQIRVVRDNLYELEQQFGTILSGSNLLLSTDQDYTTTTT